jgi:hypothetical protein
MADVRLLLRHVPALVPDDLRGVPADQLLGLALKALRRRWGFVAVKVEEVAPSPAAGPDAKGDGNG